MNTIHHIAIICSDKDAALEFYHTRLGFPIIRENYRPARVSDPEAYGLRHIAFRVASVDETVAELKGKGIPCEPVRTDTFTGGKMTFFRDPDGLPIEIHE